jgi:hypothetical protein
MGTKNKIACLMFVDDLTLISKTKAGLTALLDIVLQHAIEQDTVINIHKSTLHSTNEKDDMDEFCKNSALPLRSTPTYTHLGLVNDPRHTSNKEHIDHRINKANGILHSMINRGMSTKFINKDTCLNILNAIIIPTLTYAMEALNMTPNDYKRLDRFAANALHLIHGHLRTTGPPIWALYEYGATPPSVLVKRAKLTFLMKNTCSKTSPLHESTTVLGKALKAFPRNFLVHNIETEMATVHPVLHTQIFNNGHKFTKYGIKKETKLYMLKQDDHALQRALPLKWTQFEKHSIPDSICYTHETCTRMQARALYLYGKNNKICYKCGAKTASIFHNIIQCPSPLHQIARIDLQNQLRNLHKDLAEFIFTQDERTQVLIILGLKATIPGPIDYFVSLLMTLFIRNQQLSLL